jgi:chromosome segregation ATPase
MLDVFFVGRHDNPNYRCFSNVDQVGELKSTIKGLEVQLEEQSSVADNVISEWQGSYTTLEVLSSELQTQLETLTKEKEEVLNAERLISELGQSPQFEELRNEKDRLEQELQERNEALAAAREDLNKDAEVVHEWEGKLLVCWASLLLVG